VRSRIEVVIEVVERQVQLPQFQIVGEVAEVRRMLADHTVLGRQAVETSALQCPPGGELSATARPQAVQLGIWSEEGQRVQQRECQPAVYHSIVVAESRAALGQLASVESRC